MSDFVSISGPVERELYADPDKPLYLYKVFSEDYNTSVKIFTKEVLSRGEKVHFQGFIAQDKEAYILKGATRLPYLQNALEDLRRKGVLQELVKESPDLQSNVIEACLTLLPNSISPKDVTDYLGNKPGASELKELCKKHSFEELELCGHLLKLGFDRYKTKYIVSSICAQCEKQDKDVGVLLSQANIAIKENPYELFHTFGVSFPMVDGCVCGKSATSDGVITDEYNPQTILHAGKDAKIRKEAAIVYGLQQEEMYVGSSLFDARDITARIRRAIVTPPELTPRDFKSCGQISVFDGKYILKSTLEAETAIKKYIDGLNTPQHKDYLRKYMPTPVRGEATTEQFEAIKQSNLSPVSVLTGGPGCGKTFTVKGIISTVDRPSSDLILLAPTGKAAQRLSQMTGYPAQTVHMFASSTESSIPLSSGHGFTVIVDEASMLSNESAHLLVSALKKCNVARLVFVGDTNQLPSVGAGTILQSLMRNPDIPVSRLNKVMRQGNLSSIVQVANGMLKGGKIQDLMKNIAPNSKQDLFISKYPTDQSPLSLIEKAISSGRFEKFVKDFNPIRDMQILCPIKKCNSGVLSLNLQLQKLLNPVVGKPRSAECGSGDMKYSVRAGDKIIINKNQYDIDLVNGDVGRVLEVHPAYMRVDIDGKGETDIPKTAYSSVNLGYAMTVHKSQGSEAPVVVTVLPPMSTPLYQRNLLYTAITRSRTLQWVIGNSETIDSCIENNKAIDRSTAFDKMMNESRAPSYVVDR